MPDGLLSPTSMISRVANGAEARSTGQLNTMTKYGPETLYQLQGCPVPLASLPQLTGQGYKFYLQDDGPSLMIDPDLRVLIIPRSPKRGVGEFGCGTSTCYLIWTVAKTVDTPLRGSREA